MRREYVCITKCLHGPPSNPDGTRPARKTYYPGERALFDSDSEFVPAHFVPIEDYVPPSDACLLGGGKAIIRGLKSPVDPMKLKAQQKKASQKAEKAATKKGGE